MENEPRIPLFTTETGHRQIDELNRILSVERMLVIKTQENYRTLKEKFLEVTEDNELLHKQLEILRCDHVGQSGFKESFVALEAKSRQLIKQMAADNEDREIRHEKFRTDTLAELQKVFRKEIADQNLEIDRLRAEKEDLVNENDQLLEKIKMLRMDVDELRRREKTKEEALRLHYDQQLQKIIEQETTTTSAVVDGDATSVTTLRDELTRLQQRLIDANRDRVAAVADRNGRVETATAVELDLRQKIAELTAKLDAQTSELTALRARENEHESQFVDLHRRLGQEMGLRMKLEAEGRRRDRGWEERIEHLEESFAEKLIAVENVCAGKDDVIIEMKSKIGELLEQKKVHEGVDKDLAAEKETRERLEVELKKLYRKLEENNEEKESALTVVKLERSRLESTVAELKKKLETTPGTAAEAAKLSSQLQALENKRREEKEKYHFALNEVRQSLQSVERKQRRTQQKIQENFFR